MAHEDITGHNVAPLPPVQEFLHGTSTELSTPMQIPADIAELLPEGAELFGIATPGVNPEKDLGADAIALLRTSDGACRIAGIMRKLGAGVTIEWQLGPISSPLQEGRKYFFGRQGDREDIETDVIGAATLYGVKSRKFAANLSSVHFSAQARGGNFVVADGGKKGGASTNGTWVDRARRESDPVPEARPFEAHVSLSGVERVTAEERHLRRLFAPRIEKPARRSFQKTFEATERTVADAVGVLARVQSHDDGVRAILQRFDVAAKRPEDIVAAIRTDTELRRAIGDHYLARVDGLVETDPDMPERVQKNGKKQPANGNYTERMTSREYVAMLCLAQLDGTFDREFAASNASDRIERDAEGRVGQGQHQHAANVALYRY